MIFELLIVFLVIGFSVLFKYSEIVGMDSQLVFICLCFLIILIYKAMMYYRMKMNLHKLANNPSYNNASNQEPFYDFASEVKQFINRDTYNAADNESIRDYQLKLTKLNDKVSIMNEYLQELNNIAKGNQQGGVNSAFDELNIQASQQIQDYRIRQLQKDIDQTTDLIKKAKLRDDAKNFKKIPVYSSCVVSNADGSFSTDSPSGSSLSNNASSNNLESVINQRLNTSRMQSTVSGSNQPTAMQSTGNTMVDNLLSHISEKGVDINVTV